MATHSGDHPAEASPSTPHAGRPPAAIAPHLTRVLFGGAEEYEGRHRRWRELAGSRPFLPDPAPPSGERVGRTYDRLRLLNAAVESPEKLAGDPAELGAMHEWLAVVDGGLTTLASIHYNLFLGSLVDHGPDLDRPLDDFTSMRRVGTFLVTEVDHGNDAASLRTRAVYDPEQDGFVLDTPGPGARKFMPNTGPSGGPKSGVVAARLICGGRDEGVFLFLVPLTDGTRPRPGVRVQALPHKSGGALDHCLTSFDRVRIPRSALLSGDHGRLGADGAFSSVLDSPRRRFLRSIDRVTVGKLCMSASALGGARAALAIAVTFGRNRLIAGARRDETTPVFAHRTHHGPLVSGLASIYAMTMLHRTATRRYMNRTPGESSDAERTIAVAKGWITWEARAIVTETRERCGARGLFPANLLAGYCADAEGTITAEGDNLAIWTKAAARGLLERPPAPQAPIAAGRPVTDTGHLVNLLRAAEALHLTRARERLRSGPRGDSLARWNAASPSALAAVAASARRMAAEALLDAASRTPDSAAGALLTDLFRLFALQSVEKDAAVLHLHGHLGRDPLAALPDAVDDLVSALADAAPSLVEAFEVPPSVLEGVPMLIENPAAPV